MNAQNYNARRYFDLLDLISFVAKRWLTIAILMILGGVMGMGLSFIRPPIYESNAVFGVTIDYTQTGALTEVQEDQAMRGIGYLLLSDSLIETTLREFTQSSQVDITEAEFKENAFVDRGDFNWTIRYRSNDPIFAYEVVQTWSAEAEGMIHEAAVHALAAETYLRTMDRLVDCLAQSSQPAIGQGYCAFESSEQVLAEISRLSRLVQNEKEQSRELFYALIVDVVEQAGLPENPVRYQTNLLVLSGAFTGALAGFVFFLLRYLRIGDQI